MMLHIICALNCEAGPLIDYYHLKHVGSADVFSCYINKEQNITLTVSDPGRINAAAATSYIYEFFKCRKSDAWLNIGIAGHQSMKIGQAALAHKIEAPGNVKTWYPQIIFTPPCLSLPLKTLDTPSIDYEESMFDMEAYGFYSIASRFGVAELIHVLKIISDNSEHPAKKPDKIFFSALIEQQLQLIEQIISMLQNQSSGLEILNITPRFYEDCLKHWHFTRYEQHSLIRILRRWQILKPGEDPLADITGIKNGKQLLKSLQLKLDSSVINF